MTPVQQAEGRRAELRRRVAELTTALEDLVRPDEPEALVAYQAERAGLAAELDAAVTGLRGAEQALREARGAADGMEQQRVGAGLLEALAGMQRAGEATAAETAALVCTPLRRAAVEASEAGNPSAQARATIAADLACQRAGARAACRFAGADWCPHNAAGRFYDAIARNLRDGRIPAKPRRLLAGHFARTARQALDPKAFDAFAVAEAFYGRAPATVQTLGGPVELHGRETMLVLNGPTGRGKTLAACYLVARWGGLYMTSYDLAGVGLDPMCPTRPQMAAAPVLVIDQTGRQGGGATDRAHQVLEWAVDHRYAEERVTVLLSNVEDRAQFEEVVEDVIASRLAEVGVFVQCYGEDARRAPAGSASAGRR